MAGRPRRRARRSKKNPALLPRPGVHLQWKGGRSGRALWEPEGQTRQKPFIAFLHLYEGDRLIGGASIRELPREGARGRRAARISGVVAEHGWGPLLYDSAALLAGKQGLLLVAHSIEAVKMGKTYTVASTSPEAQGVWEGYLRRSDVQIVERPAYLPTSSIDWGIYLSPQSFEKAWGVDADQWLSHRKPVWAQVPHKEWDTLFDQLYQGEGSGRSYL